MAVHNEVRRLIRFEMPREKTMFKKKQKPPVAAAVVLVPAPENFPAAVPAAKNAKPKVFLMGLASSVLDVLEDAGINATPGSLGNPYRVALSSQSVPMPDSSQIGGYAEQEIIFVDLSFNLAPKAVGEVAFATDGPGIWVDCNRGFIDPRAIAAAHVREGVDRIVDAGGVLVVFASPKTKMTIVHGTVRGGKLWTDQEFSSDEWSFHSDLQYIKVLESKGEEIFVCEERSPLGRALGEALAGMHFECTLSPLYDPEEQWTTLAKNKFGETLALGRIYPSSGAILILPQMQDKANFIKRLLTDVFPEMFPGLFPGIEKGRWTHLPEYELGSVAQLQAEREDAVKRHESEMERIATGIAVARKIDGWLHDLLTQTGDPLVEAVETALGELGFTAVVDMDKIRDRENKPRREDLQVQDDSPTLVVDIKGISNFPGDEDAMQAFKHATLVMREQKRLDVFGLSIINHQRHLPPLQRDNSMPFRRELVEVALQNLQGLMTTWDLYRLVVNKRRHSWKPDYVKPALYRHGRIEPIPQHYSLLGRVTQVWRHAFGVDIESSSVSVGDTVALEFEIYFEESVIASLHVSDEKKLRASVGDKTGLPWPISASRPKPGMRVFVAKAATAESGVGNHAESKLGHPKLSQSV